MAAYQSPSSSAFSQWSSPVGQGWRSKYCTFILTIEYTGEFALSSASYSGSGNQAVVCLFLKGLNEAGQMVAPLGGLYINGLYTPEVSIRCKPSSTYNFEPYSLPTSTTYHSPQPSKRPSTSKPPPQYYNTSLHHASTQLQQQRPQLLRWF